MDLTTKDNVTRDSFKIHIKRFAFIVASSVTNRMTIIITDINRIQEYKVNAGVTLDAAASGGRWGRVGYWGKRGGMGSSVSLIGHGRRRG